MHVSRGGWLGQTYALAKFDDSFEGKRSGIRRSKEERKGMVETFIKRYQKSNNGDFPSLNLTRKEVGGSFYTVREIVREIIQENRVLGPPKSPPGDRNIENLDSFLEHNPLGSMSKTLEESMDEVIGLVVEDKTQKHQISEHLDVGAASLGPVSSASQTMDEKSNEREVVDGDLEEKDTENGELADKEDIVLHVNENTDVKLEDSLPSEQKNINGANIQNLQSKSVQHSTVDETNADLNKSSDHSSSNYQKRRTTATLNRINLESWEAASKKSSHHQTHQLVTFIKTFVTAFVKFWTE